MDEEIYVSCHAPSLSLLLFETARSIHDQKGLLIGQICNEVIPRKTDENEVNCEHKTAIYLEHCIPFQGDDFIGNGGIIDKNSLQKYTDLLQHKIVGWYSFRRNSRLVPNTISESLIHQSLLELLPEVKCQYFVACFMSSSVTGNMSTHSFNHVFMTYQPARGRFEPLRLKIYTLSDKSVNSNGYSMKNPFPKSNNFEKVISHVQKEETPVKSVHAINERVSEVLKLFDRKLQTTESRRLMLEQEVEELKKRLGLVSNQGEITVKEPEKEELKVKTIRYDPNVKYNPSRKTNPLKVVVAKPKVPTSEISDKEEQPRKNHDAPTSPTSSPSTGGKKGYASTLTSTPNLQPFTVKPPKNKPGLSPFPGKVNNSVGSNCEEGISVGNADSSDMKSTELSKIQHQKPMEF